MGVGARQQVAAATDKKVKIGDLCEDVWFVDT